MSDRKGGCPTTGKRQFWSRKEAKEFMRRHHYKNHQAYKCDGCRFFHVGGEHSEQSRIAHREGIGTTPINDAARMLAVKPSVIHLIIQSGKARGNNTSIRTEDLTRLKEAMYRQ